MQVRTTKTASGSTAVQVVIRHHHQTEIVKHIGSARDKEQLEALITLAHQFIREADNTQPLFPELFPHEKQQHLISVDHMDFIKAYHLFAYEFLSFFYEWNGFHRIGNSVLKDFAIMRLIEPASKETTRELLKEYFHITCSNNRLYPGLRSLLKQKDQIEQAAVSYAKKHLSFDFSLVFYDVTTLYFETFKADEDSTDEKGNNTVGLRKNGFGKEHKPGQPQILVGLVVNRDGYPIGVELFSGKTFEGHTIIPVIKKLQKKYAIETLTIVADAGMLSLKNIEEIRKAQLFYIVGARLGSISKEILSEISTQLKKTEDIYYTTGTEQGTLICNYSDKRAAKDKSDRKKQMEKAQYQINNPGKVKRKARFVVEETKAVLKLNEDLIAQDELREGIKGYYTNLTLTEKLTADDIISRYKDLWHVEKSFRIAKSDLEARPVFHHQRESIEAHILIIFVSLCLAKSIELLSKLSIKQVKKHVWPVQDIEFIDTITNKKFIKRMSIKDNPMAILWKTLEAKL